MERLSELCAFDVSPTEHSHITADSTETEGMQACKCWVEFGCRACDCDFTA